MIGGEVRMVGRKSAVVARVLSPAYGHPQLEPISACSMYI